MGDRQTFFQHIAKSYTDFNTQLMPPEQSKRLNQCLDWHRAVLQPAVRRLVEAKRRLQWFQQKKKAAAQNNSMLFTLTSEQLGSQENAYNLCLTEINQYVLPAIEDQLLIRKYFCSAQKGSKSAFSLADIVIYHELFTALSFSQINVEP